VTKTTTKSKPYGNTLVVYYSLTNNTKQLAESIHTEVGGELRAVKTTKAYPANYTDTANIVQKQIDTKELPAVRPLNVDWNKYDTIFLGSPVWYGNLSLPVQAFLKNVQLPANVHIIPFFTSGSSGIQTALNTEKDLLPNASFSNALHVTNNQQSHHQKFVTAWLHNLTVK
jgi:flavodoxin